VGESGCFKNKKINWLIWIFSWEKEKYVLSQTAKLTFGLIDPFEFIEWLIGGFAFFQAKSLIMHPTKINPTYNTKPLVAMEINCSIFFFLEFSCKEAVGFGSGSV
jgi:hypothetical protein